MYDAKYRKLPWEAGKYLHADMPEVANAYRALSHDAPCVITTGSDAYRYPYQGVGEHRVLRNARHKRHTQGCQDGLYGTVLFCSTKGRWTHRLIPRVDSDSDPCRPWLLPTSSLSCKFSRMSGLCWLRGNGGTRFVPVFSHNALPHASHMQGQSCPEDV